MNPEVLLDVMYEDLVGILIDKGWNAKTVTKELGASKEERSDDNIFKYAKETKCVVVTIDGDFVQRLRAEGLVVITIDAADKANIVDKKLREKLDKSKSEDNFNASAKLTDDKEIEELERKLDDAGTF